MYCKFKLIRYTSKNHKKCGLVLITQCIGAESIDSNSLSNDLDGYFNLEGVEKWQNQKAPAQIELRPFELQFETMNDYIDAHSGSPL
jgi:hypothetical protein